MSFCCGASMIGTLGTLKHHSTYIHQVPMHYCPICHAVEVNARVSGEYEILADYAYADKATDIYFNEYVDIEDIPDLFADCIDIEGQSMIQVLHSQIDNALDLLSFAKLINDFQWQIQLKHRLKVLSERLRRYQKRDAQQKG